jgi:hypothetical protein
VLLLVQKWFILYHDSLRVVDCNNLARPEEWRRRAPAHNNAQVENGTYQPKDNSCDLEILHVLYFCFKLVFGERNPTRTTVAIETCTPSVGVFVGCLFQNVFRAKSIPVFNQAVKLYLATRQAWPRYCCNFHIRARRRGFHAMSLAKMDSPNPFQRKLAAFSSTPNSLYRHIVQPCLLLATACVMSHPVICMLPAVLVFEVIVHWSLPRKYSKQCKAWDYVTNCRNHVNKVSLAELDIVFVHSIVNLEVNTGGCPPNDTTWHASELLKSASVVCAL